MGTPALTIMIHVVVIFFLLSSVRALNFAEILRQVETCSLNKATASRMMLEGLQQDMSVDYFVIEKFASLMNLTLPTVTADEYTFISALAKHIISVGLPKLKETGIEFLYTCVLFSTPVTDSKHYPDRASAAELALKTFHSIATKRLYFFIIQGYLSQDNLSVSVPLPAFEEGFLPSSERSSVFASLVRRVLPVSTRITKGYISLALYRVFLGILKFNVKLPHELVLRSLQFLHSDKAGLPQYQLQRIAKTLHGYLKTEPESAYFEATLQSAIRLMVADHALETVAPKSYFEFAELYHFLSSKAQQAFTEQSNNISKYQEKFQEIEKLRETIVKVKKLDNLLSKCHEIKESNIKFGLLAMDFFEKIQDDLMKHYPDLKTMVLPAIKSIINNFKDLPDDPQNSFLEQHACLILRSNFFYVFTPNELYITFNNILYALGMLRYVKEPISDFAKEIWKRITNEYIERCTETALFTNTDKPESLAHNASRLHAVITFLRTHRDQQWKIKTINKYLVNFVKLSNLAKNLGFGFSAYELAMQCCEFSPQNLYLLFLNYANDHLGNNATVAKNDLVAFGGYLRAHGHLSSTEKVFVSVLLTKIRNSDVHENVLDIKQTAENDKVI